MLLLRTVTGNSFKGSAAGLDISHRYRCCHLFERQISIDPVLYAIIAAEAPDSRVRRTNRCLNSLL
jgi:hypothetical protein